MVIIVIIIFESKLREYFAIINANTNTNNKTTKKPYLWVYWENVNNASMPAYVELCLETIKRHSARSFNTVILNEKNIYDYLPELREKEKLFNLNILSVAQKVDYYRLLLLKNYGGLYLDADTIVLKDPITVVDKLKDYDFVGFGCFGAICHYDYGRISNGVMASRKDSVLMTEAVKSVEEKLKLNTPDKVWDYFDFGKYILQDNLAKLIPTGYKYYHYPAGYDGMRDKDGRWVSVDRFFSEVPIEYSHPDTMIFFVLYNNTMQKTVNLSRDKLMNSNMNISKFFRKSFKNVENVTN